MKIIFVTLASFLVWIGQITAWKDYLSFDSCNAYQIHNVYEGKSYQISWNGYSRPNHCKIGFHGFDSAKPLNDYKVCIQASYWNINNNALTLKYYTGISDILAKTYYGYSIYDSPTTEWCSDSEDYVDIELTVPSSSSSYQGSFTLDVRAVMTYKYSNLIGWTVGGVVGGVVFLFLCVIIPMALVCRRRRRATQGLTYGSPTASTIITQSGSQQMGGYVNQGYATIPKPPPYTYPQGAPPSYQDQGSYQQYSTSGNEHQKANTQTTNPQSEQT